ncbi:MAG TPA: tetratricopeptide repeat protein [Thermoanaerobaculia bacterium]|nr:tetratricopeptide repeat protein [Thermoanaerobaculia bacterium]
MTGPVLLILALLAGGGAEWYDHYERGVLLIEQGKGEEALAELERALAKRPEEGLDIPARALTYVDYLPYVHLAIAAHMSGDAEKARLWLDRAEKSGLAARSDAGRPLLVAWQILLRGKTVEPRTRPGFTMFARKPTVISDEEFERLKGDVLGYCGIDGGEDLSNAPWYAHYELALEVERKGDPQRALDLLLESVARRPDPQRKARMYGMWLIDYYPYFQIAKTHMQLQNWQCASDALEISTRLREITPEAREYNQFVSMQHELERRIGE